MTTAAPSAALATIQPAFTDPERLALVGFLAGSQALRGNGTPNWRSFARQWQRPDEAAHMARLSRTATQDEREPPIGACSGSLALACSGRQIWTTCA